MDIIDVDAESAKLRSLLFPFNSLKIMLTKPFISVVRQKKIGFQRHVFIHKKGLRANFTIFTMFNVHIHAGLYVYNWYINTPTPRGTVNDILRS